MRKVLVEDMFSCTGDIDHFVEIAFYYLFLLIIGEGGWKTSVEEIVTNREV